VSEISQFDSLKIYSAPHSNKNLFETPYKNKDPPSLTLNLTTCPTTTSKNEEKL